MWKRIAGIVVVAVCLVVCGQLWARAETASVVEDIAAVAAGDLAGDEVERSSIYYFAPCTWERDAGFWS